MKKILITETQAKLLVSTIQQEQQLNESWKDIVLSVAMLAGVGLTGQNKIQAQSALSNSTTLQQVKAVLQDDRLEKVIDSLESAGMKNAEAKIYSNAEKIENELSDTEKKLKLSGDKVKIYKGEKEVKKNVKKYKELQKSLIDGYSIKGITQDTIKKIAEKLVQDTDLVSSIEVSYNIGDLFSSGGYILSSEAKEEIKNILEQYKKEGLVVIGIRIESSTDKQRVSPKLKNELKNYGYDASNQGLSAIRNDQIKKALLNLGVDTTLIKQDVKFNEGSGTLDAVNPQDAGARYVKIYIDAIEISNNEPTDSIINTEEDVIKYNFELVKINKDYASIKLPEINFSIKPKNTNKRKCKISICPTFN